MLALPKVSPNIGNIIIACSPNVRGVLLSVFEIRAMLVFIRYSPRTQKNADDLVKLPVIDKHDVASPRSRPLGNRFKGG